MKLLIRMLLLVLGLLFLRIVAFDPGCRSQNQGRVTACKSNLKNLGTGVELYLTAHPGEYPLNLSQLTPKYLKTIPECPSAHHVSYRLSLGAKAPLNAKHDKDFYPIECMGENHRAVCVTGDYPAYNATQGLIERAPTGRGGTLR